MGVVATNAITRGTRILEEPPLFKLILARGEGATAQALKALSEKDIEGFLRLTNCHPNMPLLSGIVETNSMPCGATGIGPIAAKAGLFLTASRFNSSCRPNVNNIWHEESQTIRIYALRDIADGEELCLCYVSLLDTKAERHKDTMRAFAFECTCVACRLTGVEASISDNRRKKIAKFHGISWTPTISPETYISMVYIIT